jgi:hypothetical protein
MPMSLLRRIALSNSSASSVSAAVTRTLATAVNVEAQPSSEASSSKIPAGKWTPYTQRTGVLARKRGMTALWDQQGNRYPVTVLQVRVKKPLRSISDDGSSIMFKSHGTLHHHLHHLISTASNLAFPTDQQRRRQRNKEVTLPKQA